VLAASLNSQQRSRLQLIGRTAAPTRYTERTDDNRIRIVAIDFGGVELGQCADDVGNLLPASCLPPSAEPSSEPDCTLSSGMFRQYSTQVGTTVDTSIAVALLGGAGQTYYSHNFFVLEWRRYCLQSPSYWGPAPGATFVSGIERGVAVRIIFDVKLQTIDANLAVNFGLANLSTALARNEARVEVSYEVLGTTLDLVPSKALIVTSLSEYLDAVDEFYRAVKIVSGASGMLPPNYSEMMEQERESHPIERVRPAKNPELSEQIFPLSTLAYYVSGPNVGANYDALSNVPKCQAYTAKDSYLLGDIEWTWNAITALEQKLKRNNEERARLRRERKRLQDLRTERRVLAALSAELNCHRACAAESARLGYVRSVMTRKHDEYAAWQEEIEQELAAAEQARDQARQELDAARQQLAEARKVLARARKTLDKSESSRTAVRSVKKCEADEEQAETAVEVAEEKWWRALDTIEWLEQEEAKRTVPRETLFTCVPCRPVELEADRFGMDGSCKTKACKAEVQARPPALDEECKAVAVQLEGPLDNELSRPAASESPAGPTP
jgi:hypothetical protein